MDLQSIRTDSKNFCRSHDLESWAKALPSAIKLRKEAEAQMARAEKLGLEQALVVPDFKTQMASIAMVIAETAMKPVAGIPVEPKFAKIHINVTVVVPL